MMCTAVFPTFPLLQSAAHSASASEGAYTPQEKNEILMSKDKGIFFPDARCDGIPR